MQWARKLDVFASHSETRASLSACTSSCTGGPCAWHSAVLSSYPSANLAKLPMHLKSLRCFGGGGCRMRVIFSAWKLGQDGDASPGGKPTCLWLSIAFGEPQVTAKLVSGLLLDETLPHAPLGQHQAAAYPPLEARLPYPQPLSFT